VHFHHFVDYLVLDVPAATLIPLFLNLETDLFLEIVIIIKLTARLLSDKFLVKLGED
jgi:hypothetical protein